MAFATHGRCTESESCSLVKTPSRAAETPRTVLIDTNMSENVNDRLCICSRYTQSACYIHGQSGSMYNVQMSRRSKELEK